MLPNNYSERTGDDISTNRIEDALERLQTMYKQEHDTYNIKNTDGYKQQLVDYHYQYPEEEDISDLSFIDICDCRYKMVVWCYDLLEFCQMSTDTVEVAMSIIDRYMFIGGTSEWINRSDTVRKLCIDSRIAAWTNKKIYQLVSMSSIYTSVKIIEPIAFDPQLVSTKLSRGTYTPQQIEKTESILLETLQWKIHHPTVVSFVHEYMILIHPILLQLQQQQQQQHSATNNDHQQHYNHAQHTFLTDQCIQESFMETIQRQIKLCTLDYNFITVPSSIRAMCCIANAFETLEFNETTINKIEDIMFQSNSFFQAKQNKLFYIATKQVLYQMYLSNEVSSTSSFLLYRTYDDDTQWKVNDTSNLDSEKMINVPINAHQLQQQLTEYNITVQLNSAAVTNKKPQKMVISTVSPGNFQDEVATTSSNCSLEQQELDESRIIHNMNTNNNNTITNGVTPTKCSINVSSNRIVRNENEMIEFNQIASPSSTMDCGRYDR